MVATGSQQEWTRVGRGLGRRRDVRGARAARRGKRLWTVANMQGRHLLLPGGRERTESKKRLQAVVERGRFGSVTACMWVSCCEVKSSVLATPYPRPHGREVGETGEERAQEATCDASSRAGCVQSACRPSHGLVGRAEWARRLLQPLALLLAGAPSRQPFQLELWPQMVDQTVMWREVGRVEATGSARACQIAREWLYTRPLPPLSRQRRPPPLRH